MPLRDRCLKEPLEDLSAEDDIITQYGENDIEDATDMRREHRVLRFEGVRAARLIFPWVSSSVRSVSISR